MNESDREAKREHGEGDEPSTGPGPGQPVGETLPGDSGPTGTEELKKPDVGFGSPKPGKGDTGNPKT
jgi:hypothetical protein